MPANPNGYRYDSVNILTTRCTVGWDGEYANMTCEDRGGEIVEGGLPLQRDARAGTRRREIVNLGSVSLTTVGRRVSDGKYPHYTEQWISS